MPKLLIALPNENMNPLEFGINNIKNLILYKSTSFKNLLDQLNAQKHGIL